MLKQLKNNKGTIFVTVLIILLVTMTLAINTLSVNVTQVTTSEDEVRKIQAEMLALGSMYHTVGMQRINPAPASYESSEILGSSNFRISSSVQNSGGALSPVNVSVTY